MKNCLISSGIQLYLLHSVSPTYIVWKSDHNECISNLITNLSNSSQIQCREALYMKNVKKGLIESKSNSYVYQIYSAINDLYTDLISNRNPVQVNISRSLVYIHPISFCIPEENIIQTIPSKTKSFGRVIPGVQTTYYHLYNESQYFEDMSRSIFTITYKKGGWDCLRHYEILAAGSLPLFVNIKFCPNQTMTAHPKRLYNLLFNYPGLELKAKKNSAMTMHFEKLNFDNTGMDLTLYSTIVAALLHYTHTVLSTRAMASYVLETMYKYSNGSIKSIYPKSILYLTHQDHDMDKGDYMTDFLLHGLKIILGDLSVIDFPRRDGIYKTIHELNHTSYLKARQKLYGSGFSWGLKLDDLIPDVQSNAREYHNVKNKIMKHEYDVVILGSGHRDGWASRLHFWDLICQYYHPLEVGWVDGSDKHLHKKLIEKYSKCAGHMFSREGYMDT